MDKVYANYSKAGLFLFGDYVNAAGETKRAVIAPYSEGRFGDDDKAYVLAKGSIDEGLSPLRTALKETKEETGFNIEHFLGEENITRLEAGETLTNITHPDFPGVTIKKFAPHSIPHTYKWHGFKENKLAMFGVEFEGIHNLLPFLKNRVNGNGLGHVGTPVRDLVADQDRYPVFADFIQWLNAGQMPQRGWNEGSLRPHLQEVDGQSFGEWFSAIKKTVSKQWRMRGDAWLKDPSLTPSLDQWERFNEAMQHINGHTNSEFRHALKIIKEELSRRGILTGGDDGVIKLDEKDLPFRYYQEGADILDADQYLFYSVERMRANKSYAQAQGGAGAKQNYLLPREYLENSQIIACAPYLRDEDIDSAEAMIAQGIAASYPAWDRSQRPTQSPTALTEKFGRKVSDAQEGWIIKILHEAEQEPTLSSRPALA